MQKKQIVIRIHNKIKLMDWYEKYLSIYEKPFSEVPQEIIDKTHDQLIALQSNDPMISIIIVAYNEEKHLQACLWSLSEIKCKYPVEFIGVDNESKDRTAEIYQKSGIPYYTEHQHTCGYARQCGLNQAKGKYTMCIDSDTIYPPYYFEIMVEQLMKPGISAVPAMSLPLRSPASARPAFPSPPEACPVSGCSHC